MSDSTYTLTLEETIPSGAFDLDATVYAFRREIAEAKHFFDDDGKSSGLGGTWRSIEQDLRTFTANRPYLLVTIEEETKDYDHKARHYGSFGRYTSLTPKMMWPEFSLWDLT